MRAKINCRHWLWLRLVVGLILGVWFSTGAAHAFQENAVRVRFQVRLTESAATDEKLFLAGNHAELGNWLPDGLPLNCNPDGLYFGEIDLPPGIEIQFKVTRGTWDSVEKGERGNEIPNRTAKIEKGRPNQPQLIEFTVQNWSKPSHSTVTGVLKQHENFTSQFLTTPRTISVWLPPCYSEGDERYPVLYMQDGQNLFDQATAAFGAEWQVDETATRLIKEKKIPPIIIVGVWNTPQRLREYTPTQDANYRDGGAANDYLRCLVEEIKPFIDENYRTRPGREDTAIGGSSLGGLFSLYAAMQERQVFFGCAAFSPSLFWDQENLLQQIEAESKCFEATRLYADMGTLEGRDADAQKANRVRIKRLATAVEIGLGQASDSVWIREIEGARHNEPAWAERFGDGLEFLFGQSVK